MNKVVTQSQPGKITLFAIILIVAVAAGLFYYNSSAHQAAVPAKTVISQSTLEQQYGMRVNLVAVTAAGGMVDLRLKLLNGEKAKRLLQDKRNFPALYVSERDITLSTSEDAKSQPLAFEDNADLFLLFPNAGNAVKPGTPVSLVFGDIALEPLDVK